MTRLLITGARGFVGRHCLLPALAAGFDVWATASSGELPAELASLDLRWRVVDLLECGAIESLMDEIRPTHALHMAWETTHGTYWTSPANLDWLALGARFFKAFAACGGERFVAAGTCAEYDWTHGHAVEDATTDRPATFYGRIKLAHHHMLMASAEQLGFRAATGRIFFAYGPHENRARLIPYTCRQLAAGEVAAIANGDIVRDFMHVQDVAAGFVALLRSETKGACNVCSGRGTALSEIARVLGHASGRPDLVQISAGTPRAADPPELVGANERLCASGWEPRISLQQGLIDTYCWWRRNCLSAGEDPGLRPESGLLRKLAQSE
jgi:UDP-glucose 4-epimerase